MCFTEMEYRNAGHTAVLTSVAIVEEAISGFASKEEYMRHVQNRSVFTNEELEQFGGNIEESNCSEIYFREEFYEASYSEVFMGYGYNNVSEWTEAVYTNIR